MFCSSLPPTSPKEEEESDIQDLKNRIYNLFRLWYCYFSARSITTVVLFCYCLIFIAFKYNFLSYLVCFVISHVPIFHRYTFVHLCCLNIDTLVTKDYVWKTLRQLYVNRSTAQFLELNEHTKVFFLHLKWQQYSNVSLICPFALEKLYFTVLNCTFIVTLNTLSNIAQRLMLKGKNYGNKTFLWHYWQSLFQKLCIKEEKLYFNLPEKFFL